MNCKWCDKKLEDKQVYQFLSGKSKGTACSSKCSMMLLNWISKENFKIKNTFNCVVCKKDFIKNTSLNPKVCSIICQSNLSSERMTIDNPMFNEEYRKKVSDTLKKIKHKPFMQGGNGRGATNEQLALYNELIKIDDSFQMEFIEKTKPYSLEFKAPNHYKIDIASSYHKLAIEIDGVSHNNLKTRECDKRKTELLTLKGWKVLRLSNLQIQKELTTCVQAAMSMI
jgi:hypothetical protein